MSSLTRDSKGRFCKANNSQSSFLDPNADSAPQAVSPASPWKLVGSPGPGAKILTGPFKSVADIIPQQENDSITSVNPGFKINSLDEIFEKEIFTKELVESCLIDGDQSNFINALNGQLKKKLGVSFEDLIEAICKTIPNSVASLIKDAVTIAPFDDYSKLLEEYDEMAEFLLKEAVKPENWFWMFLRQNSKIDNLLDVTFYCKAVNDGKALQSTVFLSKTGKIRHCFSQVDTH